jgi:ribosomal protein L40E
MLLGIVALLVVALLPSRSDTRAQMEHALAHRTCPHCLSQVPIAATACRFCRRDLPSLAASVGTSGPSPMPGDGTVELERREVYIAWSKMERGDAFRPVHYRTNGFTPDMQWNYVMRIVDGVLAPYIAQGWRLAGTVETAIGREWMANRQDQYLAGVTIALQRPLSARSSNAPESAAESPTLHQILVGSRVPVVPLTNLVRSELTMLRQDKQLEELGVERTPYLPSEETIQWIRQHPNWMAEGLDESGLM